MAQGNTLSRLKPNPPNSNPCSSNMDPRCRSPSLPRKSLFLLPSSLHPSTPLTDPQQSNILPAALHPPLGIRDYASLGLFAGSLLFEIIADRQKSAWRAAKDAKQHDDKFITSGLWSISRHPKYAFFFRYFRIFALSDSCSFYFIFSYVGEVGIWTGIWALSTSALQTAHYPSGTAMFATVSPLLTYYLLRYVCGFCTAVLFTD